MSRKQIPEPKGTLLEGLEQQAYASTVTFIVVARHASDLETCLAGIAAQTVKAAEVLVAIRKEDAACRDILPAFSGSLPAREVEPADATLVAGMNACLAHATGRFIALVDEAAQLPPEWLRTMIDHLYGYPEIIACGARDLLVPSHTGPLKARTRDVGRFHWYGRIARNHHCGAGKPRSVDLLSPGNQLFRGDFLRDVGFETQLRGEERQPEWEVALALEVRLRSCTLFYDPDIEVVCNRPMPGSSESGAGGPFSPEFTTDTAFNETWVIARHAHGGFRFASVVWQLLAGSIAAPGLFRYLGQLVLGRKPLFVRLRAALKGRWQAFTLLRRAVPIESPATSEVKV